MALNILCAFACAFVESLHDCSHPKGPYAVSAFSGDFLFFDLVIALVLGTVGAVLAIGVAVVGSRYSNLQVLTDRRFIARSSAATRFSQRSSGW